MERAIILLLFSGIFFTGCSVEKPTEKVTVEVTYGYACGYGGGILPHRAKLDSLVAEHNMAALEEWLDSPIAAIQVYAVDGFFQLYIEGCRPSREILDKINRVKAKKENISFCMGCIFYEMTVHEATSRFVFE